MNGNIDGKRLNKRKDRVKIMELIEAVKQLYAANKSPVFLFDEEMSFLWSNASAEAMTNGTRIDHLMDLCYVPDPDQLQQQLSEGISCQAIGSLSYGVGTFSVIPVGAEKPYLILAVLTKQSEKWGPVAIEQIVTSVAAQYREPVFAIHNMLGPIKKELEKHECYESYQFLERIGLKCYQTMRSTSNLVNYFKYNAIDGKPKMLRVNINRFIEQTCASIRNFVGRTDIGFGYEICKETIISDIQPEMLSVALYNLVANSCMYTNPGNQIVIRLTRSGSDYIIMVSDKGLGIPDEIQPRVFEPFYSYDPDGSPASGVGLGLSIVKQVAELHDGSCVLTSELNQGTVVAMRLPIVENRDETIVETPCSEYILSKFSPLYLYLADICGINTIETL